MRPGWQKKLLGDICESKLGKTLNASTDQGEVRPYLCAVNVKWDTFDLATIKTAPFDADEIKKYSVRKGDLLVCEGGETGRAAIWDREEPIQYQNALHRIRFKEGTILPRFCLHYLRFLKISGVLDKEYSHGATILHLVTKSLYSIPIEYPSLTEQHRIVDILDQEFAKIDALKANAEKSLQAAKDLFQATLKKELEPKKGWKTMTIGELSHKITDGSHNPPKGIADSKYRMLSSQNVWNGYLDKSVARYLTEKDFLVEDRRTCAREGDVLLTIVGTIGRTCVLSKEDENITFQRSVCIIKPKPELNPFFLCYQLQSKNEEINQQANGAAQKGFYLKQVQRLHIQLASLQEQAEIVSRLDDLNDKCNTLQENYQKTLTLCDDLKQSLLRKAFNGEL